MSLLRALLLCLAGLSAVSALPASGNKQTSGPGDNASCQPGSFSMRMTDHGYHQCVCGPDGLPICQEMNSNMPPAPDSGSFSDFFRRQVFSPPQPPPLPHEIRDVENCTINQEWMEECNKCKCIQDNIAICTKKSCLETTSGDPSSSPSSASWSWSSSSSSSNVGKSVSSGYQTQSRCTVGTSWSDECKTCTCVTSGQVMCQHRLDAACLQQADAPRSRRRRQTPCTPGTVRPDGCNNCTCLAVGIEICTRRGCLPESPASSSQAGSPSQKKTGFQEPATGPAAASSIQGDCTIQECPQDCSSRRDDSGCFICCEDPDPFFGRFGPIPIPMPESKPPSRTQADEGPFFGHDGILLKPIPMPEPKPSSTTQGDCTIQECPQDCSSRRDASGCLICCEDPEPFFGRFEPMPKLMPPSMRPSLAQGDCTIQECPQDCSSRRNASGCLICCEDQDPFFGRFEPMPKLMPPSMRPSLAQGDCTIQECPQDCSSRRDASGCLICCEDQDPFFGRFEPMPKPMPPSMRKPSKPKKPTQEKSEAGPYKRTDWSGEGVALGGR